MNDPALGWSLFLLRLGVFVVMLSWSLDKLFAPEHAAGVFENFYFLPVAEDMFWVLILLGIVQLIIEVGFLLGIAKFWTYGFVLVAHGISTVSTLPATFMDPLGNVLWAGWPMLAACVALFLLRDRDTKLTLG